MRRRTGRLLGRRSIAAFPALERTPATATTALARGALAGVGHRRRHPTADAQPLILEAVWPRLQPLLK